MPIVSRHPKPADYTDTENNENLRRATRAQAKLDGIEMERDRLLDRVELLEANLDHARKRREEELHHHVHARYAAEATEEKLRMAEHRQEQLVELVSDALAGWRANPDDRWRERARRALCVVRCLREEEVLDAP